MTKRRFTISKLAEKAGVSVRTIRYYIDEGLIPPPNTTGRYASYGDDYLIRIRLIKALQNAYLPLKEIRKQIGHLNIEEIAELLAKHELKPPVSEAMVDAAIPPDEPDSSSALEYLSRVIDAHSEEKPRPHTLTRRQRTVLKEPSPVNRDSNILRRFKLREGIELTVQEDIYNRYGSIIDNWIINARKNFKKWIKEV